MEIQRPSWQNRQSQLHGEQRTHDGRIVHWEALVRRAWGWPSAAGNMAAAEMKRQALGGPLYVHLEDGLRQAQQDQLFAVMPGLREVLCRGLCYGATKEVADAHREISSVTFSFTRAITDDGIVTGMMRALAIRLACTVDDIRNSSTFDRTYDGGRHVTVNVNDFESK